MKDSKHAEARDEFAHLEDRLITFLEDVLGLDGVKPGGGGSKPQLNAHCPFCADEKPDHFYIAVETGLWHCHKCTESGNLHQLVEEVYELGMLGKPEFRSAQSKVDRFLFRTKATSLRLSKPAPAVAIEGVSDKTAQEIWEATVAHCERAIRRKASVPSKALRQLRKRISDDCRKRFRIGYVPTDLAKHLVEVCGLEEKDCIAAGVLLRGKRGLSPKWRGALLIPDIESGAIVGLNYRLLHPVLIERFGKYRALGGYPRRLFNVDALGEADEVVACEGAFDAMSLVEHEFPAVGIPGNGAFKKEWAERFRDAGVRTALVLLDNGETGSEDGRRRIRERLEAVGVEVIDIYLPDESKDANEFFTNGGDAEAFRRIVEECRRKPKPKPVKSTLSKRESGSSGDELPLILLGDRPERDMIGDAWDAAVAAEENEAVLFRRGGHLVRIERGLLGIGLNQVGTAWLRGHLGVVADWVAVSGKRLVNVAVRESLVKVMHARPDERLRLLERVLRVPVFDRNGELLSAAGYVPSECAYLDLPPDLIVPDVPKRPTADEVRAALELLTDELLVDFPFEGEADRAHALAALILPFARRLFDGCTPLHLAVAPGPGAGKTLLWMLVGILFLGMPVEAAVLPSADDELRKRITAQLVRGNELALFDNVDAGERADRIDSATLASVLTTTTWTDRVLGSTEMITVPNATTWLMTGNNIALSMELTRRSIQTRLTPAEESPWLRDRFRHPDLTAWAMANRAQLIHAILTLIQSWIAAGRPKFSGAPLGSFVAWTATIGGILENAGVEGFLNNLDDAYEDTDAETTSMTDFVSGWAEEFEEEECAVEELRQLCVDKDLLSDLLSGKGEHGQRTALGRELAKQRDRSYAGFKIIRVKDAGHRGRTYRLEKKECRDEVA